MADDIQATDAARRLAEEKNIDLSSIKGSGADGQVTKPDVEQAEPEAESATEKQHYVYVNPDLGRYQGAVVVGDRVFAPGEELADNVVTESEFKELKSLKDREYGIRLLLKGREV